MVLDSAQSGGWQPRELLEFTSNSCQSWETTREPAPITATASFEKSAINIGGIPIGVKHQLRLENRLLVELDVINRTGQPARFISKLYNTEGNPLLWLSLTSDCKLRAARKINYNANMLALNIVSLDAELAETDQVEWLNPPLEPIQVNGLDSLKKPGNAGVLPLRVGMVDSGVNYQLAEINNHLARDTNNKLIGYDFWDEDNLPYDAHPTRSDFFIQRHGTRTASLLLREVAGIELVAYRYPRPDMSKMAALVEHANRHQVTILGMPLGSNIKEDWIAFEQAARAHPQMLFIVSAGNNGRNIDDKPVYPAALDLDNMLVVTSADDFVRPAERTNWGPKSVDYLIPAENIALTDYSGKEIKASGSSYAVSRMTALAARLKMLHRQWNAIDIIAELRNRYSSERVHDWVSTGYVADPLAGRPVQKRPLPELNIKQLETTPIFQLALEILVLDPGWTHARIEQAVQTAYHLLEQCGIDAGKVSIDAIIGDDYLRDLSTGSSRTLLEAVATTKDVTLVLARDTRMQEPFTGEAFGPGNTRSRPWLTNSVWLMLDIEDEGIALAHELYHVIANSGEHVEGAENLMQSRTEPTSLELTPRQCQRAHVNGKANQLLVEF